MLLVAPVKESRRIPMTEEQAKLLKDTETSIKTLVFQLGATKAEISNTYPGDEFVPNPNGGYTQAIKIQAPSSSIWPY